MQDTDLSYLASLIDSSGDITAKGVTIRTWLAKPIKKSFGDIGYDVEDAWILNPSFPDSRELLTSALRFMRSTGAQTKLDALLSAGMVREDAEDEYEYVPSNAELSVALAADTPDTRPNCTFEGCDRNAITDPYHEEQSRDGTRCSYHFGAKSDAIESALGYTAEYTREDLYAMTASEVLAIEQDAWRRQKVS